MLRRPLDQRFSEAVKEGRKVTTIRPKPWPVCKQIMLYCWSGKPYRSKQSNVAIVEASGFWTIRITRNNDNSMSYEYDMEHPKPLYETEGFETAAEMDEWFRHLLKPGQTRDLFLMWFFLLNVQADL